MGDKIEVRFSSGAEFQKVYEDSIAAQRRSFNSEEHLCKICTRKLLGDRFFFLQGCGHSFCLDCLHSLVTVAIKGNKVDAIICAEASCRAPINTLDIKKMGLDQELAEKYDQMSIKHAISQMDDVGWCPLNGCGDLATIDKELNMGKCQHCDFMFCLGCKDRYHPFRRCSINRIDHYE